MNKISNILLDRDAAKECLSSLSETNFKELGADHIAYIREMTLMGQKRFVTYRADGQKLSVTEDIKDALALIKVNDMEPVTLQ